jgi:murein L,D-transpeptidase YcbB/YkuD
MVAPSWRLNVLRIRFSILTILGGALLVAALHPARCETPADTIVQELHSLVDQAQPADAQDKTSESAVLRRFYEAHGFAPAWVGHSERIGALSAVFAGSSAQGLQFAMPKAAVVGGAQDVALTRLALAYALALAEGRVLPEHFETDWGISPPAFDAAAWLNSALAAGDLAAAFNKLPPHHQAYRRLMTALALYRSLAENKGWVQVPRGNPLKLGMVDERVRAIRQRLVVEGDMTAPEPADAPAAEDDPATHYDAAVEAGVRRFQRRNGIVVDGAVGPRTLATMNITVKARIQQIELNLERWRSLPHELGASFMLVNVPAQQLDIVNQDVPVMNMKVVVGDIKHPTPIVRTHMVAVTFNPTWTIPASIVTKELKPKIKHDPNYLTKNDIVWTPGRGFQQMPGPKNPLGQIKFESPNLFDVYMHDTPSRQAFDRYMRAQSHGCVRLERAAELAGYVLAGMGWDGQQIGEAVARGETQHVDLKRRWPVYILYATSFVDDNGVVEFRDDLYGRDARLKDALTAQHMVELQHTQQAGLGHL